MKIPVTTRLYRVISFFFCTGFLSSFCRPASSCASASLALTDTLVCSACPAIFLAISLVFSITDVNFLITFFKTGIFSFNNLHIDSTFKTLNFYYFWKHCTMTSALISSLISSILRKISATVSSSKIFGTFSGYVCLPALLQDTCSHFRSFFHPPRTRNKRIALSWIYATGYTLIISLSYFR